MKEIVQSSNQWCENCGWVKAIPTIDDQSVETITEITVERCPHCESATYVTNVSETEED